MSIILGGVGVNRLKNKYGFNFHHFGKTKHYSKFTEEEKLARTAAA